MFQNFPNGRGQLPRILSNDDGEVMTEPLYGNRFLNFFSAGNAGAAMPLHIKEYDDLMTYRMAPALDSGCDGWSICYNFGRPMWEPPASVLPGKPDDPLNDLERRWHNSEKPRQFFLSMRVNDMHHRYYNWPRLWTPERLNSRKYFIGPVSDDFWNNTLLPWIEEGKIQQPTQTENGLAWATHPYPHTDFPELAKTALCYDFTHREVRDLYINQLEEALNHCDADGVELDFLRFWYLFPAGEQKPALITDWIGEIRGLIDRHAARTGHPVKLIARVLENTIEQEEMGHDVEAWLKCGYLDAIISGRGFLYSHPCIKEQIDLAHKYGCPVYGAFDSGHFCRTRFRTPACMRAAIAALYQQGVDGIYFFNHYSPSEYYLFDDAANPEYLKKLPKEFFVDTGYLHDWPWESGGLPADLENGKGEFYLVFADEPERAESLRMDYDTSVPFPISLKINGKTITLRNAPGQATSRFRAELTGALKQGRNKIELEFPEKTNIIGIGITSA